MHINFGSARGQVSQWLVVAWKLSVLSAQGITLSGVLILQEG